MAALLKALGLKVAGGNFVNMKRTLQRMGINTDHWTGQAWQKDKQLKDYTSYTNARQVKVHLIKKRGWQCECCKLTIWMDQPITLELHHIDGDRTNNQEDNLQLLCPNCHSFTDNWRNRSK